MKKLILYAIFAVLIQFKINAQIDTSFWFAVPEVSSNQVYSWDLDRPIFFHFSTLDAPANVILSIPSNSNFTPIVFSIAANSSYSLNVTQYIDSIENKPSNTVLNKGVKISSTSNINVYYEVVSTFQTANPELFTLKGKNALGLEFFIPSQDFYSNATFFNYQPTPYSSFDIIATENNTTVSITPSNPIVGHAANTTFTISLNKGQTFNCMATSQLSSLHLGGSHVTSNKPIAITIVDDLLQAGNLADLCGDQIVPITKIGKEYIAIKSQLLNNLKSLFIMATQNNTNIYIDGATTPVATLNTGQTYSAYLNNPSTYIRGDKDIYVLQVSGMGGELGMAILPYIPCTGSKKVSYKRVTSRPLDFCILVKNGDQNGFTFNGSSTVIPASSFASVPGTGGNWLFARIAISNASLPVNSYGIIRNSMGAFHLGIIEGQSGYGAGYGYFSDFSTSDEINIYTNHSPENNFCVGDTLKLFPDTLIPGVYNWSGPSGFNTTNQTPIISNVVLSNSGTYSLNVTNSTCLINPLPVNVTVFNPTISLPNDTTICFGDQLTLTPTGSFTSYVWSTGATTPSIAIENAGTYWVRGISNGCFATDTIHVSYSQNGQFSLGNDTIVCNGSILTLSAPAGSYSYLWSNGSVGNNLSVNQSGTYWLQIDNPSICPYRDSIVVTFAAASVQLPIDTTICSGTQLVLVPTGTYNSLLWSNGLTNATMQVNATGTYWVKGIINNTCFAVDSINITVLAQHPFSLGNDSVLCDTSDVVLTGPTGSFQYLWSDGSLNSFLNIYQSGQYWLTIMSDSICPSSDTVNLTFVPIPNPNLGSDTAICDNQPITITDGLTTGVSTWSNGTIGHSISVNNSGTYWVTNSATHNCNNSDTIIITAIQAPPLFIGNDTTLCQGQTLIINAGSNFDSYLWNTGDTSATINISRPGNYSIHVSEGPCSMTDYINILPCPCTIWSPNTFTPNFDNINDSYYPVIDNVSYLNMKIFNRWGELLYEETGLNSKWDGRYKGRICPEGVYFCVIKYKCDYTLDKLFQTSSSVTLIQ